MTELVFHMRFHGPFRVGTGRARDGVAATIDLRDPLPASHLKGLMRAAAREVLLLDDRRKDNLVDAVFGAQRNGGDSPWAWDSGYPLGGSWDQLPRSNRVRIAIDDTTGTAKPDHLAIGEELWPTHDMRAVFTICLAGHLPEAARPRHEALLRLAARAVTTVGTHRRRGLGWVTIRPAGDDDTILAADLRAALGREVS